jgi:hypothetical protein
MIAKLAAAALAALQLISMASIAQAALRGHQGEAPPWSFACTKDHGPSQCGEPIWIYGNQ